MHVFVIYRDRERPKVKIISTSPDFSIQVIFASDKISDEERKRLVNILLSDEKKVLADFIRRFAGKSLVAFVAAEEHEVVGYSTSLEDIVLNWQAKKYEIALFAKQQNPAACRR